MHAERGLVFTWGNGKKGQLGLGYQGLIGTSLPRRGECVCKVTIPRQIISVFYLFIFLSSYCIERSPVQTSVCWCLSHGDLYLYVNNLMV